MTQQLRFGRWVPGQRLNNRVRDWNNRVRDWAEPCQRLGRAVSETATTVSEIGPSRVRERGGGGGSGGTSCFRETSSRGGSGGGSGGRGAAEEAEERAVSERRRKRRTRKPVSRETSSEVWAPIRHELWLSGHARLGHPHHSRYQDVFLEEFRPVSRETSSALWDPR